MKAAVMLILKEFLALSGLGFDWEWQTDDPALRAIIETMTQAIRNTVEPTNYDAPAPLIDSYQCIHKPSDY
jgi:hypothetical protein